MFSYPFVANGNNCDNTFLTGLVVAPIGDTSYSDDDISIINGVNGSFGKSV